MNVLFVLATILFILMVLVGGKKGLRSFLSLFFNFIVLIISIYFMLIFRISPIIVTIITCVVISCINLFFVNEVNGKTKVAFISTLITMFLLLLFIEKVTKITMIQGFGSEQSEALAPFSLYIGVDFFKIETSVIIMSTIGAVTEVAISMTSSMREALYHNPLIGKNKLFLYGIRIGKDILGTDTNTLFFAFYGGYMALLLWFHDLPYSIGKIVNSKLFSAEVTSILCAGIGIALIIPITSFIYAYFSAETE